MLKNLVPSLYLKYIGQKVAELHKFVFYTMLECREPHAAIIYSVSKNHYTVILNAEQSLLSIYMISMFQRV